MPNFPAPVGGTPYELDFAPSILFAVLYFLLLPLVFYRMYDRRSRCTLLIGTAVFTIERIVVYSLRASMARSPTRRVLGGLVTYSQISYSAGYIGVASDLVQLVRCLLINPTYGSGDIFSESPAGRTKDGLMRPPPDGTPDQPKQRFWIRRFCDLWGLVFLAGLVPSLVASSKYDKGFGSQAEADLYGRVRYAGTAVALFCNVVLYVVVVWGSRRFERTTQRGATVLYNLMTLICVISFYRLSIMRYKTDSLTAPGGLNSVGNKATFYVFHIFPEWLLSVILFAVNIRKTIGTSFAGDHLGHDMTETEKQKAAEKKAEKEEKKKRKDEERRMKDAEKNELVRST